MIEIIDRLRHRRTNAGRALQVFQRRRADFPGGAEMQQKPTRSPIPLEAANGLRNDRGTLAMARTSDPNSATAQFFINVKDNESLNAKGLSDGYAVFGRVVSGLETVDRIRIVSTASRGQHHNVPVSPIVISRATIEK